MYSGLLRGVNCIYDDGTVIPIGEGPCQDVLDSGAALVDSNVSESEITVTTAPPDSLFPIMFGLAAFMWLGGKRVSKRPRR